MGTLMGELGIPSLAIESQANVIKMLSLLLRTTQIQENSKNKRINRSKSAMKGQREVNVLATQAWSLRSNL